MVNKLRVRYYKVLQEIALFIMTIGDWLLWRTSKTCETSVLADLEMTSIWIEEQRAQIRHGLYVIMEAGEDISTTKH